MNISDAIVYDIETLPNCFTLAMEAFEDDRSSVWEISDRRDDRSYLIQWFAYLHDCQIPMISFFGINFDYPVIHYIFTNPTCSVTDIYNKAQDCLRGDRFANTIWADNRFAPQVDLFKINHFDNKAKTTSLKALQVNMRSPSVVDSPIPFGEYVQHHDIDRYLIPYNHHDVQETKRFAHFCRKAIDFRIGLIPQFGIDVMNYNDTKIGAKMMEQRLGEDICFERKPVLDDYGNPKFRRDGEPITRKAPRQTVRYKIPLKDVIFPYVQFRTPEFQRVLDYMRAQVLTPDDLDDPDAQIKTKGVFAGLHCVAGGMSFHYGTGGVHGSIEKQRIVATDEWLIRDIDVASLYPSIAIVNGLAPAHLGSVFTAAYAQLPIERKRWQAEKGKKCVEANAIKLASNGTYGNSNNKFSWMLDAQYTMATTINGQLLLSMLAEWLMPVPTFQIIQINTDGITYRIHRDYLHIAQKIEADWQAFTCLVLEDASYSRMWIRDVNNYIAESPDGSLKLKGAYWSPDPLRYGDSISEQQPPAWHKDLGNCVSIRAAVAAMVHGLDPDAYIRLHTDPFDFMMRARATQGAELLLGGQPIQKTTRYYVARNGGSMVKRMPALGPIGWYKKARGTTEQEYQAWHAAHGNTWSETIHTKNKSQYELRDTAVEAGWNVAECNDASRFDWNNVEYRYYIDEARKLII